MSEAKTPIRAGWHPVRLTDHAGDRLDHGAWLRDVTTGELEVRFDPDHARWRISEHDHGDAFEEYRPGTLSLEEVMAEAELLFAGSPSGEQ